jgi:phytoene dehydrogenase-like protein
VLYEARSSLGGRAQTETINGFRFNEGAHALYAASVVHIFTQLNPAKLRHLEQLS